jgi:uncharacterized iron-regulated protein
MVSYRFKIRLDCILFCFLILGGSQLHQQSRMLCAQSSDAWSFPAIEHIASVRDGVTQERLTWGELISQLSDAEVVFLGETHDDDSTHRLQFAVFDQLLSKRDGRVVLAMEMFERDVQAAIDDYLQGGIDEAKFLESSRPWSNYREAYRPLVERAKQAGSPVLAANFPRPLLRQIFQSDAKNLEVLGENRKFAPQSLLENPSSYWKRVDNATRGHAAFMPVATDQSSRLMSTQSLWDNAMGETCAEALRDFPQHQVVHVNGGFHSQYWEGAVHQLLLRRPETKVKTVSIQPASNPYSAEWLGAPVADYVVFVESRAKNLNDGSWGVVTSRKVDFQLHLPQSDDPSESFPLFLWLPPDGLSVQESMDYWKGILGDRSAIAVIGSPYRQQQFDLSLGGKWFWEDRFSEDISAGILAIERVWQYVLDRFPIDANRVVLAGEKEGATVCCAATLLTSKMSLNSLAITPKQYAKLKDFPLPLPEDWGQVQPPERKLIVVDDAASSDWWQQELDEYTKVGISTERHAVPDDDPWESQHFLLSKLEAALGLELPQSDLSKQEKKVLVAQYSSPKEVLWLRRLARQMSNESTAVSVVTATAAENLKPDDRLDWQASPERVAQAVSPCPGPFGGTTILVLNESQAKELDPWLAIEQSNPLAARSRFHRLRISTGSAGPKPLSEVMERLLAENRKNVLIVPAEFYAPPVQMRELESSVSSFADQMTIHWLPGVGGGIELTE